MLTRGEKPKGPALPDTGPKWVYPKTVARQQDYTGCKVNVSEPNPALVT